MAKARVAALRTRPECVVDDVQRLLTLVDARDVLDGSECVLAAHAPWNRPAPGVSTTPWQLQGAVRFARGSGATKVACQLTRPPALDGRARRDPHHLASVCAAERVAFVDRAEPGLAPLVERRPRTPLDTLPAVTRRLEVPELLLGRTVLHLPTLRSDARIGVAGALAAVIAAWLPTLPTWVAPWRHGAMVDALRLQAELGAGAVYLMDGTTVANGSGPHRSIPLVKNVLLASTDPVALDAAGAQLMGFDPRAIESLARAEDAGLGVADPADIEWLGDDLSAENWGFAVSTSKFGQQVDGWLDSPALQPWERALARSPLAPAFMRGAELWFDGSRWPEGGKQAFDEWRSGTAWGRLFDEHGD